MFSKPSVLPGTVPASPITVMMPATASAGIAAYQITALKRVPTRTQCRRTAALFCRFRRLKAGGTREFHSIEGKLISH